MQISSVLLLITVVMMMSAGQVLFKLAAQSIEFPERFDLLLWARALISPVTIAALTLYGVATILWVLVLRDVALSRAYPFIAISLFVVPLCGILIFKENFSWGLVTGGGLILIGVFIIAMDF